MRFVGIQSLVQGKDSVVGETAFVSNAKTVAAAANDIAKQAGLSGEITTEPHAKNTYQTNLRVNGATRFRILDETAPRRKLPTELRG